MPLRSLRLRPYRIVRQRAANGSGRYVHLYHRDRRHLREFRRLEQLARRRKLRHPAQHRTFRDGVGAYRSHDPQCHTLKLYDNTVNNGSYTALSAPTLSPSGTIISAVPTANLVASHQYYLYWNPNGDVRDINGNYFNGGNANFTTSAAAVTTAPTVVYTNPSNAFTNVPIDLTVQILFSEPIQASTISGVTLSAGGNNLTMTPAFSNANQTLTLIPRLCSRPTPSTP